MKVANIVTKKSSLQYHSCLQKDGTLKREPKDADEISLFLELESSKFVKKHGYLTS